jgi:hypothetical protein
MFWKWKYAPKERPIFTPKKEPLFVVSSIKKRPEDSSSDEENIDLEDDEKTIENKNNFDVP